MKQNDDISAIKLSQSTSPIGTHPQKESTSGNYPPRILSSMSQQTEEVAKKAYAINYANYIAESERIRTDDSKKKIGMKMKSVENLGSRRLSSVNLHAPDNKVVQSSVETPTSVLPTQENFFLLLADKEKERANTSHLSRNYIKQISNELDRVSSKISKVQDRRTESESDSDFEGAPSAIVNIKVPSPRGDKE